MQQGPDEKDEAAFIAEKVEECAAKLRDVHKAIASEVWGQDKVIDLTLACLLAGGHLLSVGVPGTAKTRLVERTALAAGLGSSRVQFTPDLMPSDIIGSEVLEEGADGKKSFRFIRGPVFTQFMMADEINRASPRTQAALLQAMQEKKVAAGGVSHPLPRPFHVFATQNPLEQEGTYPLPEAQLDRFLIQLDVDYPDEAAERRVMIETTASAASIRDLFKRNAEGEDFTSAPDKDEESAIRPVLGKNDLIIMQKLARRLPLGEKVVNAAVKITRRARPSDSEAPDIVKKNVAWGPGPRAVQAFSLVAKARALMDGRIAPEVEDVLAVAGPVLEHRMALNYEARANNVKFKNVMQELTRGL